MEERKGWLEKVLDDASADVESWPKWMKDNDTEHEEQKCAHDPCQAIGEHQKDENQRFR